jgi:hypothetical protein
VKTRKSQPNRRAFLRTIGGLGIGLPFLEGLSERSAFAQAAGEAAPTFGMFICTANGVVQAFRQEPEKFWPTELGPLTTEGMQAFAADRATGLLADYASRLLIVRGVNYPFPNRGCGHALGLALCLTAAQPEGDAQNAVATGISADTLIANELHPPGVEPLALYAGRKGGYIDEKLSFRAPREVRAAEGNPWNVYQRLVGLVQPGTGASTGEAERLALRRRSVNDLVREELNALMNLSALSTADRSRLDLHFTSVRDIEQNMMGLAAACSADRLDATAIEAMNDGSAFRRTDNTIEDVAKLQIDLAAFAFACNASRVATLQIGDGTDGTRYTINGVQAERFHWISHRQTSDSNDGEPIANAVEVHTEIDRLRMLTFKHLLDRFSSYGTPNGNLLDASFALWTSHVAVGPSHSFNNLPIIIAGSAGGFLRQGQYVDAGGVGNNRLLNTLITANGVRRNGGPVEDFGSPDLEGGLIDGIVA